MVGISTNYKCNCPKCGNVMEHSGRGDKRTYTYPVDGTSTVVVIDTCNNCKTDVITALGVPSSFCIEYNTETAKKLGCIMFQEADLWN